MTEQLTPAERATRIVTHFRNQDAWDDQTLRSFIVPGIEAAVEAERERCDTAIRPIINKMLNATQMWDEFIEHDWVVLKPEIKGVLKRFAAQLDEAMRGKKSDDMPTL